MRGQRRWAVVAGVAVVSAVAHLVVLGKRPLAHDEAIDAWFSWQARTFGVMRYDPVYHGPLRFYLEGPILGLVGTTALHARLLAATAGIAATAIVASQRRLLGRIGAPAAAVLFVVSPTILTVTRTGREDSLVALLSLGLLLLVAHALRAPRPAHLVAAGALLAASFATKETTFLFGLNAFVFLAVGALVAWRVPGGRCRAAVARLAALGANPWLWTLTVFGLVFLVVFTAGFRYAEGVESGLLDGIRYWWSQHDVGRGGQPWFFYLAVYVAYEWLLVPLAAAGAAVAVRRRSLPGIWFLSMAVGQLALYSWAGEKFAWLAVHPLVPSVLLAGIGVEALVDAGRTARPHLRRTLAGLAAVLVVATAVAAVGPAITDGDDPSELLVTVQTSEDVPEVADRLRALLADGSIRSIAVDQSGGGSWPWAWYLHGLDDVAFATLDPTELPTDFDAIVVLAPGQEPPAVPPGYTIERFRLRVWWVPDYEGMSVADFARWFLTRETWSPTASLDQWLLIRER